MNAMVLKAARVGWLVALVGMVAVLPARAGPARQVGQWSAEFFANQTLSGSPVLTRLDDAVDFDWGTGSPGDGVPTDQFSARWTRTEWFDSGTYRFRTRSDDGLRLWVGDLLVVDAWQDQQGGWLTRDLYLGQGTYPMRVEYYENSGSALVEVHWERITGGQGWLAEYYDNQDLRGEPALLRTDGAIDFAWGNGSPDAAIPADHFSVRWTHTLDFAAATYRFFTSTDDGVRLWVDDQQIVDAWYHQQLPNTHSGDVALSQGLHVIRVEYYEDGGEAHAHVWWQQVGGSYSGWKGEYYDNPTLAGGPALVRDDAEISFDWGNGPPVPYMPDDNWSARWTRQITFEGGYYRLSVQSDDGVRVWLDEGLVLDFWRPMKYELNYVDGVYLAGVHSFRVEYFERNGGARIRFWISPAGSSEQPSATPLAPPPTPTRGPDQSPTATPFATATSAPVRTPTITPTRRPGQSPTPIPTSAAFTEKGTWQLAYFGNAELSGQPAVVQPESAINHDWGANSPAGGVPAAAFSARWTGTFTFRSGRYLFTAYADGGVRLLLDGVLVVDGWNPARGSRCAVVYLPAGDHTVTLEYGKLNGTAAARLNWSQIGSW